MHFPDRTDSGLIMLKVKIILITALLGLGLLSVLLIFEGGSIAYDTVRIVNSMPKNVDMQLHGINFTEMNEGRREWTLKADKLHYNKTEDLMIFEEVAAKFYNMDGPMEISGEKGYYDRNAKSMRMVGKVRAKDAQGNELSTDELNYDMTTRIIVAPGSFQVEGPTMNLEGKGLSVYTKDHSMRVQGRATLVIKETENLL